MDYEVGTRASEHRRRAKTDADTAAQLRHATGSVEKRQHAVTPPVPGVQEQEHQREETQGDRQPRATDHGDADPDVGRSLITPAE
jgi:hypothetical protein